MVPETVVAHRVSTTPFAQVTLASDLSSSAAAAFPHALKLALASRGRLDIVHADSDADRAGHQWRSFPAVRSALAGWGLLDPGADETAVAEQLGLQVVKTDIAASQPGSALAYRLSVKPADLLVVGAHSRDGLSRLFHPSVAEPLARASRIPVLFVPEGSQGFVDVATGEARLRHVLIPVDHEPTPQAAVDLAIRLADLLGQTPEFHLLHVGADAPAVREGPDHRIRRMTRNGPVADAIVAVAAEMDADLIVMATAGHDSVLDALRGSIAEQVLHKARRPLLTTPANAD